MSSYRSAGLAALVTAACTPSIEPAWLVSKPRELALEVEVIAQGPYGERIVPGPRTPRDALPLDVVSMRPVVVDPDGRIEPDELEGIWLLCEGVGNCLVREPVAGRPECTGGELQPTEPCRIGGGGSAVWTMGDLPSELPDELPTVFDLISGPTVAFVGSAPDGPGLERCVSRLDARERLEGCLLMERVVGLGPLGELVERLAAAGIDPGIPEGAETLLARGRNHNPAVTEIQVSFAGESMQVAVGSTVRVPRDAAIVLTLEPAEEDLDRFEILLNDEPVELTDDLFGQWWFDREIDYEEAAVGGLWVRWRAGPVTGTVRAYVVLRDNRNGEGWGWLDLEIEG